MNILKIFFISLMLGITCFSVHADFNMKDLKPSDLPWFNVDNDNIGAEEAAKSVIKNSIDIILYIAGTISVLFVVVGGFMYVVNMGEDDMQAKAKNTILYALIWLFVVIMSYAIVENTVKYLYETDIKDLKDERIEHNISIDKKSELINVVEVEQVKENTD